MLIILTLLREMESLPLSVAGKGETARNLLPVQLLPEGRPAHGFSDSTEVALSALRARRVCIPLVLSAWHYSFLAGGLCVPHFNTGSASWTLKVVINDCWGSWDLNVLLRP